MTTRVTAPTITEEVLRKLSRNRGEPDWLLERRLAAWRAFEALPMPDPSAEEWRRTDLTGIDFGEALAAAGEAECCIEAPELPAGVVVSDLHTAAREHEGLLRRHLHSLVRADEWKYAALQAAAWQDGALVYVPRGVEVKLPLRYLVRQRGAPALPHLLIIAEENSSVTVLQEASGEAQAGWSLVSGAVEVVCGPDARVCFLELQEFGRGGVIAFSTVRARLERGAAFSASLVGLGGRLARTRLEVDLIGEGASAELLGLSFGDGRQHFDYITLQNHLARRTSSDLLFKAALAGHASEVWQGTVRIHKGAGLSEANQTSRNLLLSEHARAAPIPVLEIEAYDVLRCSHGASVGPLDEDQRFYLESRGIPPVEAERLLTEAFFMEVLDRMTLPGQRERVEQALASKLEGSKQQ